MDNAKKKRHQDERQKLRVRRWQLEHPEAVRLAKRRHMLRSRYGITIEQYDEIFRTQEGRCKICGFAGQNAPGLFLHVDHDHKTGLIRGLLCTHCNTGIGKFRDDPELLKKAAAYVSG